NLTTTDPSLNLVDSAGNASPVTLSITGTMTGWSQNGSSLISDYLFVNAGNSDPFVDWTLSGLTPGVAYTMYAYGGVARNVSLLIDHDGDGSLADETADIVAGAGSPITGLVASAGGEIIGRASPGTVTEGNWGGFQLFVESTNAVLTVDPGPGEGIGPRRLMDEMDYEDEGEWPAGADGSGVTLSKINPLGPREADNWTVSAVMNGTPGASNQTAPIVPGIYINELSASTAGVFRLELYNANAVAENLANWLIVADGSISNQITLTNLINSGEHLVLDQTDLGFRPFRGDRLYLFDSSTLNFVDAAVVKRRTRARFPDGGPDWFNAPAESIGMSNVVDLRTDVVIHEIFYHGYPEKEPVSG
ncbi:MAG: hypothetical protein AAF492_31015, partial [Verrucomicrobiota bacterium]